MAPSLASLSPFSHRQSDLLDAFDFEEAEPLSRSSNGSSSPTTSDRDLKDGFPPSTSSLHRRLSRHRNSPKFVSWQHRMREWGWIAFALVFGIVLGQAGWRWDKEGAVAQQSIALAATARGGDVRSGVWEQYGRHELAPVGTKVERPQGMPDCERVMVFAWERFRFGFGSVAVSAMLFAKMFNYSVVFSRGANDYGHYRDHFLPPPLTCWPKDEYFDPVWYEHPAYKGLTAHVKTIHEGLKNGEELWRTTPFILMDNYDIKPLASFARNASWGVEDLPNLPTISAFHPLPATSTVPPMFLQKFLQYSNIAKEIFTLSPIMRARVDEMVHKHGLDKPREVPTIGMHWRGGDKITGECRKSSQLSCGNITLHCETALETLATVSPSFPSFELSRLSPSKPRMLLMSIEPDALQVFKNEPLCQSFDIVELERRPNDKHYNQDQWKLLPAEAKIEDARLLITQGDLLANYVDAAVVSANSNSGRFMMVRAGPARVTDKHLIRSVDIYWHPGQFPPFKNCLGDSGGCYPPQDL
ncbi:hypothetical protein JCM8097_002591 [Rhodosporidiobolus ruineniae]